MNWALLVSLSLSLLLVPSSASPLPSASDLLGEFVVEKGVEASGRASCVLAGARSFEIDQVEPLSDQNGTFSAFTYLKRWNGSYAMVGPVFTVFMAPFANTRCSGSFALLSKADVGALDLTCVYLRDDLQTVDTTCKATYVTVGHLHYYFDMLLWNVLTTVGCVGFGFLAAILLFVWLRDLEIWGKQRTMLVQRVAKSNAIARRAKVELEKISRGNVNSDVNYDDDSNGVDCNDHSDDAENDVPAAIVNSSEKRTRRRPKRASK